MSKPEGYIGKLSVTWEDGEKSVFEIFQSRGFIWIGEHPVHPHNEGSLKGVLEEIRTIVSVPPRRIQAYNWVELVGKLKF